MSTTSLVSGCLLVAICSIVYFMLIRPAIIEGRKYTNGKKMIANAERVGTIVHTHVTGHTMAICLARDFLQVLDRQGKTYETEPLRVKKTFIFFDDPLYRNPSHIGSTDDAREMMACVVRAATSFSQEEVSPICYERSLEILTSRNQRLYVPFLRRDNLVKDLEYYTETESDIAKAREAATRYFLGHANAVRQVCI